MSLFGQGAGGQPQGGSLFGRAGLSGSTLVGSTQAMGMAGGNLFGPSTTGGTANTGSGLFGNPTANTRQQTGASSLFGAQRPTTGTSSLFGATSTAAQGQQPQQQQQQQPSLFGNAAGTSNLGLSTASVQPLGLAATDASQPVTQPTGAYFDSLLHKSKRQAEGDTPLESLPSLQLGLGDVRQRLKKLGPNRDERGLDGKAHYILAGSGVDLGAAVKDLSFLGVPAGRIQGTSRSSQPEIDVEAYLSNLQSKTTLSMIADGLERSDRDFDNFLEDHVTMEWESQRKRIYEHFGIKVREDATPASGTKSDHKGPFGRSRNRHSTAHAGAKGAARSRVGTSVIGTPSHIGSHRQSEFRESSDDTSPGTLLHTATGMDDRFIREKQAKFAEEVHALNVSRMKRRPFAVLRRFADIESKYGDRQANQLLDAYQAVIEMVDESVENEADPSAPKTTKERQFAKAYLDNNVNAPHSVQMRKRILSGAARFLENQFFKEVESLVQKFPREGNPGGKPDVVSKIKAYIRIRENKRDLVPDNTYLQQVGNDFVWAVVFYLLRSGHVREAANYVNSCTGFRSIDRTFGTYLNDYAARGDRQLKRGLQERCNNEYNQRLQNGPKDSLDPFRMACYKIVGRCQVQDRSLYGLKTDVSDWTWLQFNLAREVDRTAEIAHDLYTLSHLQSAIKDIGNKHFPKGPSEDMSGSYGMFFYLEILAGLFEDAITYLYKFSYVDAVHFAIALEYYGLLRAADQAADPGMLLSHNVRSQPQVSFGRMLGYYTRDFRAANVISAVDYLVLICLNMDLEGEAGQQHASLCHEALRELVLETREFSKLIGDIKPNGHRIPGVIEEYGELIGLAEEDEFVRTVTVQAASFADEKGRTTDSVLLYHLAEDYDSVVVIVSRALSEAVSMEIGEDPMRLVPVKPRVDKIPQQTDPATGTGLSLASIDDPVELARKMMNMYERDSMFLRRIQEGNKIACRVLLQMNDVKKLVEEGKWAESLDVSSIPNYRAIDRMNNRPVLILFSFLSFLFFFFFFFPLHAENQRSRHPAPNIKRRPWHDSAVCIQILEPAAAGCNQHS